MSTIFRKAKKEDIETVFQMIADRVKWMDEKGIHQWNETDYLNVYPISYYQNNIQDLYVLQEQETGRILVAAMLFKKDPRWNKNDVAYYVHNFVSVFNSHGAGIEFMKQVEQLARKNKIPYLRLDSAVGNDKLAAYYDSLGFEPCGTCKDGAYDGILREKKLDD